MKTINRTAITILPKQPYIDWANSFNDNGLGCNPKEITQGPMTTWEVLLMGLVKAVRRHGVPHNEEMARVLDEEITSSADLEVLIHHLPPVLENTDAGLLGDPAVMSPVAVQAWIKQRKAAAAGHTKLI